MNSSIYYLPIGSDGVAVGKTVPTCTLDISGCIGVSQTSYLSTISEKMKSVTATSLDSNTNTYTVNFLDGGIYYLSGGHTTASTIKLKVNNIPSIIDPTRTFIISALMKGQSSGNSYVNNVQVSANTTGHKTIIPKLTSSVADVASLVSGITLNDFILQQLVYIYLDPSGQILSGISTFV